MADLRWPMTSRSRFSSFLAGDDSGLGTRASSFVDEKMKLALLDVVSSNVSRFDVRLGLAELQAQKLLLHKLK
jgi:hypothetical protein